MHMLHLCFILIIASMILCVVGIIVWTYDYNPFEPPHFDIRIDVSGQVYTDGVAYLEEYLFDHDVKSSDMNDLFKYVVSDFREEGRMFFKRNLIWSKHRKKLYAEIDEKIADKNYPMFQVHLYKVQPRSGREIDDMIFALPLHKMLILCDYL